MLFVEMDQALLVGVDEQLILQEIMTPLMTDQPP